MLFAWVILGVIHCIRSNNNIQCIFPLCTDFTEQICPRFSKYLIALKGGIISLRNAANVLETSLVSTYGFYMYNAETHASVWSIIKDTVQYSHTILLEKKLTRTWLVLRSNSSEKVDEPNKSGSGNPATWGIMADDDAFACVNISTLSALISGAHELELLSILIYQCFLWYYDETL